MEYSHHNFDRKKINEDLNSLSTFKDKIHYLLWLEVIAERILPNRILKGYGYDEPDTYYFNGILHIKHLEDKLIDIRRLIKYYEDKQRAHNEEIKAQLLAVELEKTKSKEEKSRLGVNQDGKLVRNLPDEKEKLKAIVLEISQELQKHRQEKLPEISERAQYLVEEKILKVFKDEKKAGKSRIKYLGMTRKTFLKSFFNYLGLTEVTLDEFYKKFS